MLFAARVTGLSSPRENPRCGCRLAYDGRMTKCGTVLLLVLSAGACGVGDDLDPPNTPEPRLCTANLGITGNFTVGAMVPDDVNNDTGEPPGDGMPDFTGCWPTGTWSWTMSVTDNTCATAPTPEPTYSFRTDYTPDANGEPQYVYTLLAPALTEGYRLKVSSGGGGLCEGILEVFSPDGLATWNLHATLDSFNMSGPLGGQGEYAEWREPQGL